MPYLPALVVAFLPPDRVSGFHRHGPETEASSIRLFQGRLSQNHRQSRWLEEGP